MGDRFSSTTMVNIVVIYALVVISPGPNFVFISRLALRDERRAALACIFGVAIGATINASLTMFGLGALIAVLPVFRVGILLAGGTLLLVLGGKTLASSCRRLNVSRPLTVSGPALDTSSGPIGKITATGQLFALQQGFWLNLTNPKGIAFFIGLYAPLIVGAPMAMKLSVLAINFVIEVAWYTTVLLALSRTAARRAYHQYGPLIDAIVGAILMFLGARILFDGVHQAWGSFALGHA